MFKNLHVFISLSDISFLIRVNQEIITERENDTQIVQRSECAEKNCPRIYTWILSS